MSCKSLWLNEKGRPFAKSLWLNEKGVPRTCHSREWERGHAPSPLRRRRAGLDAIRTLRGELDRNKVETLSCVLRRCT